ncbi:hypothetical protein HYW46_00485 [Candidatus Daviesbacteria bacterium]|nr:hypothetical protein [Candidatus Daviesbacteria bacterium]
MALIWDYDQKKLQKTESGRILLLERLINYGREGNKRIKLEEVKKHWGKLHLLPLRKRLFQLLIWGK